MTKQIWINLPVKDINKSKEFFARLGFLFNPKFSNDECLCLVVGKQEVIVMLFEEAAFKNFTQHEITDTKKSTEVLFSIEAESKEKVDEMAMKAENAGGTIFGKPASVQGWMYGCGFADLDGHRWNVLYMDMSKLPK